MKIKCLLLLMLLSANLYCENILQLEVKQQYFVLNSLQEDLEIADCQYELEEYKDALKYYSKVCFTMFPVFDEIEKLLEKLSRKELIMYFEALDGRIRCLKKLECYRTKHKRETKLLEKIGKIIQPIENINDHQFLMKGVDFNEVTVEELDKDLKTRGIDYDILPNGDILVTLPDNKDCCESCESGQECESQKKN